jgi:hypothetical protein
MDRRASSLAIVLLTALPACRLGQPVGVTAMGDKNTPGTIGGIVSTVTGGRIDDRQVTAVELASARRYSAFTNVTGGFSIKVPPGDYRLLVDLRAGEKVVKEPGTVHINKSDLDANLEIVIGS